MAPLGSWTEAAPFFYPMNDTAEVIPQPDPETMGPNELFGWLWHTKYGPEIAEVAAKEAARRADAFADGVTFTVCEEELRLMTPRDLLMLDGFENAFVCATEPTADDLAFILWTLNVQNDGSRSWRNHWRKGRCSQRVAQRTDFEADVSEVYHYLDRLWLDTPADEPPDIAGGQAKERKPSGVYCLAPLMVNVAGTLGAVDPMSGRLLADTPIPRLLQYQRSAVERKTGEAAATSFDSYRSRCLEEVNNIMQERRNKQKAG